MNRIAAAALAAALGGASIFVPASQHAANENLRLRNLRDGIDTYAAMLALLHW